jgi:hypothetical protein
MKATILTVSILAFIAGVCAGVLLMDILLG